MLNGYDAWKTWTPDQDGKEHRLDCPMHEDNHDGEPAQCTCPTEQDMKEEAAERRFDEKMEEQWK